MTAFENWITICHVLIQFDPRIQAPRNELWFETNEYKSDEFIRRRRFRQKGKSRQRRTVGEQQREKGAEGERDSQRGEVMLTVGAWRWRWRWGDAVEAAVVCGRRSCCPRARRSPPPPSRLQSSTNSSMCGIANPAIFPVWRGSWRRSALIAGAGRRSGFALPASLVYIAATCPVDRRDVPQTSHATPTNP